MAKNIYIKSCLVILTFLLPTVYSVGAEIRNVPGDYPTIQSAINDAIDGDTVIIAPGTYTGDGNRDIDFLGKAITVTSIDPNDPNIVAATIIDCDGKKFDRKRGFYFHNGEGSDSVLSGLTVINAWDQSGGGILCSHSSPTVANCTFSGNSALEDGGGGMYNNESSPTLINCTFSGNLSRSLSGGGGMCNHNSSPTLINCTFSGNSSTSRSGNGGGMSNHSSSPIVINSTFSGNSATEGGGGMCNDGSGTPKIENCIFSGNSAKSGGGMYNDSRATVEGCTFSGNSAIEGGGGMYDDSRATVEDCTFSENSAGNAGGGMYNCGYSTVEDCTFIGNSTDRYGGGMCNGGSGTPKIENCIFSGNSAGYGGGGMFNGGSATPKIENCIFSGNSADRNGGGMCNFGNAIVTNSSFSKNSAVNGGGMCNDESYPTVEGCTFSGNSAIEGGGGMYNTFAGRPKVKNCIFRGNSADISGGGVCNSMSSPTLDNCIFSGNSALNGNDLACGSDYGIPSAVRVSNCILWDSGEKIWKDDDSTVMIIYSDVRGGWPGLGNIDSDPCFVAPDSNDFHLLPGSPCIDRGNPGSYFGLEPEPDGGRINMGAYGNTPEATCKYGLTLQSYNLVSKTRVGRTTFEYVYTMTMNNNSDEDVSDIIIKLLDAPNNVTILDSFVGFTHIAAGQSVENSDTFSIVTDRTIAVDANLISWCAMYDTGPGDGFDFENLALLAEQWLGPPSIPSMDISPRPEGDGIVNFRDFAVFAQYWLVFGPGTSNFPPGVSIISPEDGDIFDEHTLVLIEAQAWDYDGTVEWVEFFVNGNWIGADCDGSDGWKINWQNLGEEDCLLTAGAIDDYGATAISEEVEVHFREVR